ncbi:MAG: hypothetical protein WBD36_12340 [Bacteroidota bacterium]
MKSSKGTHFPALTLLLFVSCSIQLQAQQPEIRADSASVIVPSVVDSLPQPPHPHLLPENMSITEQALWGESGLMRTLSIVPPLNAEERRNELAMRRTMLTAHQIGGFVTLGLMATTAYYGQRVIDGRYDLRRTHFGFVDATIISYSATGLLALLSPPPMIRRDEISTTTIHKTLAWIHVAGMIATPIIGSMIRSRQGYDLQTERLHQISGYITTATFAASLLVITF